MYTAKIVIGEMQRTAAFRLSSFLLKPFVNLVKRRIAIRMVKFCLSTVRVHLLIADQAPLGRPPRCSFRMAAIFLKYSEPRFAVCCPPFFPRTARGLMARRSSARWTAAVSSSSARSDRASGSLVVWRRSCASDIRFRSDLRSFFRGIKATLTVNIIQSKGLLFVNAGLGQDPLV